MRVKVVSVLPVDYESKKTHQNVVGAEISFLRPFNDREKEKNPRGSAIADKIFTRLDTSAVMPDKQYDLIYECTGGRYADLVEIKAV